MTLMRGFNPQKDEGRMYRITLDSLDESYNPEVFSGFYAMWPQGQVVAADAFDKPIGYISAVRLMDGRARIMMIAVDRNQRSKGIGSEMLARFRMMAMMSGITAVTLEVRAGNERAIRFYERNRFRKVELLPNFYSDGDDGVRMESPTHLYI